MPYTSILHGANDLNHKDLCGPVLSVSDTLYAAYSCDSIYCKGAYLGLEITAFDSLGNMVHYFEKDALGIPVVEVSQQWRGSLLVRRTETNHLSSHTVISRFFYRADDRILRILSTDLSPYDTIVTTSFYGYVDTRLDSILTIGPSSSSVTRLLRTPSRLITLTTISPDRLSFAYYDLYGKLRAHGVAIPSSKSPYHHTPIDITTISYNYQGDTLSCRSSSQSVFYTYTYDSFSNWITRLSIPTSSSSGSRLQPVLVCRGISYRPASLMNHPK